jgi:hypothetical protein
MKPEMLDHVHSPGSWKSGAGKKSPAMPILKAISVFSFCHRIILSQQK